MTRQITTVVFDWAGTMVDFGCCAPVRALRSLLIGVGLEATEAEVRRDMGMAKRDHIARLLAMPRLHDAWIARHGAPPTDADADRLHDEVEPLMIAAAAECAQLIPGARTTFEALRADGVRVGSGTGYTRAMMAAILPQAAAQGYAPELVVCAGETTEGRPSPQPMLRAVELMQVTTPPWTWVKVDDAPVGVAEGCAAGAWTVGLAASGNETGLSLADYEALSSEARDKQVGFARQRLAAAGADLVVDSVADLPVALARIEDLLRQGFRPKGQPS